MVPNGCFLSYLISFVLGLPADLISWFSCTVFLCVISGNLIGTDLFLLHTHGGNTCAVGSGGVR